MPDVRRREVITLLGGAAAASWPLAAPAQQQGERVRRIGVLMASEKSDPLGQARFAALRQALNLGWNEGRNLRIEDRWSGAAIDRIQSYAAELGRVLISRPAMPAFGQTGHRADIAE